MGSPMALQQELLIQRNSLLQLKFQPISFLSQMIIHQFLHCLDTQSSIFSHSLHLLKKFFNVKYFYQVLNILIYLKYKIILKDPLIIFLTAHNLILTKCQTYKLCLFSKKSQYYQMEETMQVQQKQYLLRVESQQNLLNLTVIAQEKTHTIIKVGRVIDIMKDVPQISCFGSAAQVVRFIKKRENYELCLNERIFWIKWGILGEQYSKQIKIGINLKQQEMSKLQTLQFENMMLKYTIQILNKDNHKQVKQNVSFHQIPEQKKQSDQRPQPESIKLQEGIEGLPVKLEQPAQIQPIAYDDETVLMSESDEQLSHILTKKNTKKIIQKKRRKGKRGRKAKYCKETLDQFVIRSTNQPGKEKQNKQSNKVKEQYLDEEQSARVLKKLKKLSEDKMESEEEQDEEDNELMQFLKENKVKNQTTEPSRPKKKYSKRIKEEQIQRGTIIVGNRTRIDYNNGDYYLGQISNGKYHGFGIYSSVEKGVYEGEWVNGFAEGKGTSVDIHGNRHSGKYRLDRKHGLGVDEYINRDRYEGQFQNDCKHGTGTYFFMSGDKYEGQWRNNMCDGRGTETYVDGSIYTGYWKNDQKDGEGVFTDPSGKEFLQEWKEGTLVNEYSKQD